MIDTIFYHKNRKATVPSYDTGIITKKKNNVSEVFIRGSALSEHNIGRRYGGGIWMRFVPQTKNEITRGRI